MRWNRDYVQKIEMRERNYWSVGTQHQTILHEISPSPSWCQRSRFGVGESTQVSPEGRRRRLEHMSNSIQSAAGTDKLLTNSLLSLLAVDFYCLMPRLENHGELLTVIVAVDGLNDCRHNSIRDEDRILVVSSRLYGFPFFNFNQKTKPLFALSRHYVFFLELPSQLASSGYAYRAKIRFAKDRHQPLASLTWFRHE